MVDFCELQQAPLQTHFADIIALVRFDRPPSPSAASGRRFEFGIRQIPRSLAFYNELHSGFVPAGLDNFNFAIVINPDLSRLIFNSAMGASGKRMNEFAKMASIPYKLRALWPEVSPG